MLPYYRDRSLMFNQLISVPVFTKIAKSHIEDNMEAVIKFQNYKCKGI